MQVIADGKFLFWLYDTHGVHPEDFEGILYPKLLAKYGNERINCMLLSKGWAYLENKGKKLFWDKSTQQFKE